MRTRDVLPPHERSYSVDEFCLSERMSRVSLYAMWKQGKGPRFYMEWTMPAHHPPGSPRLAGRARSGSLWGRQ